MDTVSSTPSTCLPNIGPLKAAGPLVTWIVGALDGAAVVGGLGGQGAAMYSVGIPSDSIHKYEIAIKSSRFIVVAQGNADAVAKAEELLGTPGSHAIGMRGGVYANV